jgi:adenylate kinase
MKSLITSLLLIVGIVSTDAFVPQSSLQKTSLTQSNKKSPSVLILEASSAKDKKASRSAWAEKRGIISTSASGSSTEASGGRAPKLIIAGAPASGKGTQCELIKEKYGVVHLSTGDMLRAAVAAGTEVGKMAKDFMDAGKLVPDEVIIGVVSDVNNQ